MNQEAFFRAVERLSDEGEIIRVEGMYIKKSDAQGDITELLLNYFGRDNSRECLPEYTQEHNTFTYEMAKRLII
ncbi:MAG: hypothetical protein ACLR7D_11650 [Lachnospira eligens]